MGEEGGALNTILLWIALGATWVVLMMMVVQVSRLIAKFQEGKRDLDANIIGLVSQLKMMQTALGDIIEEMKKSNQLETEGLELKRAELTGDFEIVEEPLEPTPAETTFGAKPTFPELR